MTIKMIEERMKSLNVQQLGEMRSELEVIIRDESETDKKRNEARQVLRICTIELDRKNTVLDMNNLFKFNFR